MRVKIALFVILSVFYFSVRSQSYSFDIPTPEIGWHLGFAMKGVTVEPGKLTVHTLHHNRFQTRTLQIPQSLILYVPSIFRAFSPAAINGAGYGSNIFKSNKKYEIDFVFNLDWFDLLKYSDNALFVMDILSMRLTTDKNFEGQLPGNSPPELWRFDFQVPLNYEQELTLAAGAQLSKLLIKGEFETTDAFTRRTAPDSLRYQLGKEMGRLSAVVIRPILTKLNNTKPGLNYNADTELFTIDYGSLLKKTIQVKVPLSQARELKEGYTSGKYSVVIGAIWLGGDGELFIDEINFRDNKDYIKTKIFKNIASDPQLANSKALLDRIFNELIKKHPNGKLLKG